ncbi:hypothetical protein VTN77DRAFT_2164 [Rasamsonia byssochlamydoides]|uniref:uncharacterized protein n=1 Tax=Rasamsonia byssochlamydoides TaxID=89139 RepID=UPI003743180F
MAFFPADRVVYISGAGSGIGRASALQFLADGAQNFALVDIASGPLKETSELLSSRNPDVKVLTLVADLTKEEEVNRVFSEIRSQLGRLDVAVNCAGITGTLGKIEQLSSANLDQVLNINLRAMWLCEKAEIQQFLTQEERPVTTGHAPPTRGNIVNISSMLGIIAMPTSSPYVISKHGVIGLTKTDALDYASKGIRVNAVCPGFVKTNLFDEKGWEAISRVTAASPMGRLGTPEEIAYVVTFLASDRASFITGSCITADGGFTAK